MVGAEKCPAALRICPRISLLSSLANSTAAVAGVRSIRRHPGAGDDQVALPGLACGRGSGSKISLCNPVR